MSDEEVKGQGDQGGAEGDEVVEAPRTEVTLRYSDTSRVIGEEGRALLALFVDAGRSEVAFEGTVREVIPLREALSAMWDVVQSDFRYKPKDRSAYLAYQRMRKATANLSAWQAQQAYFDWLARNDPLAWLLLDPVITAHPDELLFEVFSKDEGSYARMAVDWDALELEGEVTYGTTNIDFGQALYDSVRRMRSYRATRLAVTTEAVGLATEGRVEVLEKSINVPDSWLRGFFQVQSAATLPTTTFTMAPIDLYNLLRHLRLNADQRKGGRAVRVELVPGESPRLVLEPWELVLETGAELYQGQKPEVIRIWGRRRLRLIQRFLPFVDKVEVRLLGTGLPSFFVLRAGPLALTLGITGFSSANWAQALGFDVLLPRPAGADAAQKKVLKHLGQKWSGSAEEVAAACKLEPSKALEALQACCQQGLVMFDVARGVYRSRPLIAEPLDPARLEYRNDRERVAHDLLGHKDAVKISSENQIWGTGLEVTGKVAVAAEKREYRPQLLLDEEGRVRRAECTCAFYRKHTLKEGPCAHLIALRLLQARLAVKRAAQRGKARSTITVETRTYVRRGASGESICQLSLDRSRLKMRWGHRSDERLRVQNLWFDSVSEARAAYFARIDELEVQGYLDATAG